MIFPFSSSFFFVSLSSLHRRSLKELLDAVLISSLFGSLSIRSLGVHIGLLLDEELGGVKMIFIDGCEERCDAVGVFRVDVSALGKKVLYDGDLVEVGGPI